jgi:anti-sigma regulatory factor (Ser/Thr protein kinase)
MEEYWSTPATVSAVSQLRRAVGAFLARAGVPDPLLANAKLAVSEAVTNVVVHGYPEASEPGPVNVKAAVERDGVHIVVADEGVGFAPRLDSPGVGLGLPVIAALADELSIDAEGDGTRLELTFALARRSGQLR